MVYERGIAYGGSYLDTGYDIRIDSEKPYDAPSPLIGPTHKNAPEASGGHFILVSYKVLSAKPSRAVCC